MQMVTWHGAKLYCRISVWNGASVSGGTYPGSNSSVVYQTIVNSGERFYLMYSVSDDSPYARIMLDYTGTMRLLTWNSYSSSWIATSERPSGSYGVYDSCGLFGYLTSRGSDKVFGLDRELVDTWKTSNYGENLYIRLGDDSPAAVHKNSHLVKIVPPVVACLLLLTCIAIVWKLVQRKKEIKKKLMLRYLSASSELGGKTLDFPFVSFKDIVDATDNFSDSNMLGMGGFGKVYKGILEGDKQVAIKRLGSGSGQGIWYHGIPERAYVWVANRDNPIGSGLSGNLVLTNSSDLVLSDSKGSILWRTTINVTAGGDGAVALLLEAGNFVVQLQNFTQIWQSYDHPTDTILPGFKLWANYKTHTAVRIIAWNGSQDPSTGKFVLSRDPSTGLQILTWRGTRKYWRSGLWNGAEASDENGYMLSENVDDGKMIYSTFNTGNSSSRRTHWKLDYRATCCSGPGVASHGWCLDGFELMDSFSANFSRGCVRKEALTCRDYHFLALPGMKVPDEFMYVRSRSFEECTAECERNCSCTAYAYANLSSIVATGGPSRCLVWTGELVDLEKTGELGGNLYLRLAGSPGHNGKGDVGVVLKIVLPVISFLLILSCIYLVCICKRRGKQVNKENLKTPTLEHLSTSQEVWDQNLELCSISFEEIASATNSFHDMNVLGKGGFGKVYKGTLEDGKEVAVKRLSKGSEQGIEHFINEVVLIAKLQHKNLVRLLGCCIHEDEKLLIYEYLPNKSLDNFLFDNERKSMLDWPRRFNIIKGVARGLLYLHQDSRTTIIHRDLKPSNILLDMEMNPKISDFGMARIFGGNEQQESTRRVVGTYGYMSPEYAMEGTFSVKSDTYSFDSKGRVLWRTTNNVTTGGDGAVALLLEAGNFVLQSRNFTQIWQSYDHPTDTILPSFKLWANYKAHTAVRLVAWKGPQDPSTGKFFLSRDPGTGLQVLTLRGRSKYWRSGLWNGAEASDKNGFMWSQIVDDGETIYSTYNTGNSSARRSHWKLDYNGNLMLRIWSGQSWMPLFKRPDSGCRRYGSCGPFGYCDMFDKICRCLDGFQPADGFGAIPSRGCVRMESLTCRGDHFLTLPEMKVPDKFVYVRNRSFEECTADCERDCSCTAYAYTNLSSIVATGGPSRCLIWTGELVDSEKAGMLGGNLYLRLAGSQERSPAVNNTKSGVGVVFKIALPVIFVLLTLICIYLVCIWKPKGIQVKNETLKRPALEHLDQNLEFRSIRFQDIATATNSFHDTNVLGKGGFGKVYKGTLEDGKEVAVKRLSKGSDQGIEHFRNEVVLIAKLQHKNLVRLLGCCIHEDEKLLIYEYLPNKSLDQFLFDIARKSMLDWPKRFNIIKGVARGLMYLHQDSRTTIIHRDLKPSNILLDVQMNPKISDFGMARIFGGNEQQESTRRVVGTYGYMSPEYAMEGIFSVKSDTYSFGILLLEIVSGLKISSPHHLVMDFSNLISCAWNLWADGKVKDFVDAAVMESYSLDEVSKCIHVGLLCVQDSSSARPHMSSVVSMLDSEATPRAAPKQPMYFAQINYETSDATEDLENSANGVSLTALEGR
ncbi:hypothetical protein ZWY2020_020468 [Hordeum vulgare]|nr:hypothetical protein ZWY2020_020468 [Hordeum vulgare]